ncbi:ABC-2 type transport system ATP-binding protein [Enterococcus sp. PF1-24]|uniref:ABC transporter ATP-binding protein n=1 Tax=unclassified Enterococcus TaxID=2608891 RepID=UPI002475E8D2|nr:MULTISPECIES: ABC transporter ATP-binding protein [unclassified Enterococcus]MDH6365536.1 ABC-2 type transport system ATP-binding protein [Enterococcus sp. PFB1-1]MDH6402637.1 ABC-2 type transport system ATP-binding protein [Enterococcus sp. PF1-24]
MIIEIKNLVKRYDELTALNHLNLVVEKGEILGLLGPNGSGKSTSINCMLSLLSYDKGEINLFGQPMRPDQYEIKRKIGVVPQEIAVFDELTVRENINYFCGLYIQDSALCKKYVEEAIQLVGLEDFTKFVPSKLSGGLKRRLNIACGIAHKPELIFLDEPTVAVDPQSRNKILESIRQLNQQGATIVYTTHYMEEVELLCNRIVIIDQGQVIAEGTKESLKQMIGTNEKLVIEVPMLPANAQQELNQIAGVADIFYDQINLTISTTKLKETLIATLDFFAKNDLHYGAIHTQEITLNDVFLEITGKELRD